MNASHMALKAALHSASREGLLHSERLDELERHIAQALGIQPASPEETDAPAMLLQTPEETEAPRFIRGFHDVLISIGVVILLVGLAGLGSIFAVAPAIVVLSEILVKRQRLALPAVVLTVAAAIWSGVTSAVLMHDVMSSVGHVLSVVPDNDHLESALNICLLPLALGLYAWRYRVPLSVALFFVSALAFGALLVAAGLAAMLGVPNIITSVPSLTLALLLVLALGLFALAMSYDLADRQRVTRKADIAFWLHLLTAPVLLYSGSAAIAYLRRGSVRDVMSGTWQGDLAGPVVALVLVLMLIGILIDRRAFVTSGLIALIAAVSSMLRGQQTTSGFMFMAPTFVGAAVLLIGVGWQWLRVRIMRALPVAISSRLPPAE